MYLIRTENITDPALNLAIEEYVVRHFDFEDDYLFLYINKPSVIIGKHQNPFEEAHISWLQENYLNFYRRISGGGTVYHDYGNLNFCYFTKSTLKNFNTYKLFLNPIVQYLRDQQIPVEINERNDLVIENKKVSGNAQFTSRRKMLSHGTLLYSSDLQAIKKSIKKGTDIIQSKSTKSKRSRVSNISDYFKNPPDISEFKNLVEKNICNTYKCTKEIVFTNQEWKQIQSLAENKYKTWEWNFGLTPEFSFLTGSDSLKFKALLKIKNCTFSAISVQDDNYGYLDRAWEALKNKRFEKKTILKILREKFPEKHLNKIVESIYPF